MHRPPEGQEISGVVAPRFDRKGTLTSAIKGTGASFHPIPPPCTPLPLLPVITVCSMSPPAMSLTKPASLPSLPLLHNQPKLAIPSAPLAPFRPSAPPSAQPSSPDPLWGFRSPALPWIFNFWALPQSSEPVAPPWPMEQSVLPWILAPLVPPGTIILTAPPDYLILPAPPRSVMTLQSPWISKPVPAILRHPCSTSSARHHGSTLFSRIL